MALRGRCGPFPAASQPGLRLSSSQTSSVRRRGDRLWVGVLGAHWVPEERGRPLRGGLHPRSPAVAAVTFRGPLSPPVLLPTNRLPVSEPALGPQSRRGQSHSQLRAVAAGPHDPVSGQDLPARVSLAGRTGTPGSPRPPPRARLCEEVGGVPEPQSPAPRHRTAPPAARRLRLLLALEPGAGPGLPLPGRFNPTRRGAGPEHTFCEDARGRRRAEAETKAARGVERAGVSAQAPGPGTSAASREGLPSWAPSLLLEQSVRGVLGAIRALSGTDPRCTGFQPCAGVALTCPGGPSVRAERT